MLALPYVVAFGALPALEFSPEECFDLWRVAHPAAACAFVLVVGARAASRVGARVYEAVRRERYLVGETLVNYESEKPSALASS
eukprot:UC1_evm1s1489